MAVQPSDTAEKLNQHKIDTTDQKKKATQSESSNFAINSIERLTY